MVWSRSRKSSASQVAIECCRRLARGRFQAQRLIDPTLLGFGQGPAGCFEHLIQKFRAIVVVDLLSSALLTYALSDAAFPRLTAARTRASRSFGKLMAIFALVIPLVIPTLSANASAPPVP